MREWTEQRVKEALLEANDGLRVYMTLLDKRSQPDATPAFPESDLRSNLARLRARLTYNTIAEHIGALIRKERVRRFGQQLEELA